MKASETRRKAREFLKTLSGKYQLFIVPIVLPFQFLIIKRFLQQATVLNLALQNQFQVSLEFYLHYFLRQQVMLYLM